MISICIPTYNRPVLLCAAIKSCYAQTHQNFEILVGDDSKTDEARLVVEALEDANPGKIRYFRNIPSLGQGNNVNALFKNAAGSRIVLLHDDDLLLPNALQDLSNCWNEVPSLVAAFGKQYLITQNGTLLPEKSDELNYRYYRRAENAGLLPIAAVGGVLRMFPNDGFMVLTQYARDIGYRGTDRVGEACDFDFGLRLCATGEKIFFLDRCVSKYRISNDAISKTAIPAPYAYRVLREVQIPDAAREARTIAMNVFAPAAVSGFARMGLGLEALRILISSDYPLRQRLRLRFLYHVVLVLIALCTGARGVRFFLARTNRHSSHPNHDACRLNIG